MSVPPAVPLLPAWKEAQGVMHDLRNMRQQREWLPTISAPPPRATLIDTLPRASWTDRAAIVSQPQFSPQSDDWTDLIPTAKETYETPTAVLGDPNQTNTLGFRGWQLYGPLTTGTGTYAEYDAYHRLARGDLPPHLELQRLLNFEREHSDNLAADALLRLRLAIGNLQRLVFHHGSG
jgi:hypothetical protein